MLSYVNLMGILYVARVHVVGHGWLSKTGAHDDAYAELSVRREESIEVAHQSIDILTRK